jgi:glycosyltransferase involved in cell wall biosynthesis
LKHIVILGSAHPLRGGLSAYNERLALEFQKQGCKVTIYTFSLQYPSFLFPGSTQYSSMPPPEGITILVKVNSINPFNWISVGRELKKMNPEVLLIKYWIPFMAPCLGTIARIVRKNNKTKVISILDNVIPHEKRILDNKLSAYFVKVIDGFIAMSEKVRTDLRLFTKSKPCLLIPHPVYDNFGDACTKEVACTRLNLDPANRYILFFGFIRNYKGLDLLLQAMAEPGMKESGIRLIVAGEYYEDKQPYLDLIETSGIGDQLVMATDFIPDAEVKYYFSAADLVVQPYKSATQSGISQMAYHFEKPMVVTNVGGLPEIVPDGKAGYVVPPEPKAISVAILDFFINDKANSFIAGLKAEKLKYSWKNITDGILQLAKN